MKVLFGSWKYILKNIWYVLPLALIPAVFLALSLDYPRINEYVFGFFGGSPRLGFLEYFRVWSVIRIDSVLGFVYNVCALVGIVFFGSFLFILVEKHMRLGIRSPRSIISQLGGAIMTVLGMTALYLVLYELWALILSAVLFAVAAIGFTPLVYVFDVLVYALSFFALFYVVAGFYLLLPCKLMTGFHAYDAFLYSYRLASGIRGRLILSYGIFMAIALAVLGLAALLPQYLFCIVAFVLYAFLYLDFCIRMETAYFYTDKLDREDLLRRWKEY